MNATEFQPSANVDSANELTYTDTASGRYFGVRVRTKATDMEVITGKVKEARGAQDGVRFFLEEFIPNGRLSTDTGKGAQEEFMDIPARAWSKARVKPSTCWRAVRKCMAANPGFHPIMVGSGYGLRSIFYASLEECAAAATNALDTDMWVQSHESAKHFVLAERVLATMEAKGMLDRLPGGEQIAAAALEIGAALAPTESLEVGEHMGGLRLDVTDSRLEHPACCRLLLMFSPTGQVTRKHGFYRGGWGGVANRIAGFELRNYDGPDGISHGFPAFGQAFGNTARPAQITDVEVLHKMEGTTNKVYVFAVVSGKRFFAWGRFAGGKLQTKSAGASSYEQMSKKRAGGYDRIDAESIPDIWQRLLEAANDLA